MELYDCYNSPFIELQTPLTAMARPRQQHNRRRRSSRCRQRQRLLQQPAAGLQQDEQRAAGAAEQGQPAKAPEGWQKPGQLTAQAGPDALVWPGQRIGAHLGGPREVFKLAVMLPTVPLRLLVIVWAVVGVAACNSLAIRGCDLDKPLPRWRRRLVELSSQGFNAVILRCAGFWRPRVTGLQHWEEGKRAGAIGIFNHVSYCDAFVIVWALCPAGLTFAFTTDLPVLGRGIRALQNLYLPRETDRSKQQGSMVDAVRKRCATPGMPPLVIAPEGTLSHGRCLLSFKTGGFVAGTPVVPILFTYKLTGHNPGWGVIRPYWHLLRLMTQFYNHVDVECLPVYYPSEEERCDPQLYASNVRSLMARRLGVPLVDQDRAVSMALERAGVRPSYDGRRVDAPPGVLDARGRVDLGPWMHKGEGKKAR